VADKKQSPASANDDRVEVPPPKSGGSSNSALKIILIIVGAIVVLGLLALAAFGWFFKEAVETVTDNVDVSQEDGSFQISSQDGDNAYEVNSGDTKQLPDDFPSQVMLIEPYTIQSSSRTKVGQRRSWIVNFNVDGEPQANFDQLVQVYDQDDSWEELSQVQSGNTYNVTYSNEVDNLRMTISISSGNDDQTYASYSVVSDPEQG